MTGRGLRLGALVGIALVASAHVGSPDTYFEGAAGAYPVRVIVRNPGVVPGLAQIRSEEHTSELQSRLHLVCRLLLEKKKNTKRKHNHIISKISANICTA